MQVKMYTKNYCGFCFAAKRLLAKRGIEYDEIHLAGNPQAEQEMRTLTGRTSVPQIFINNAPIGGFEELAGMDMNGELEKLSEDSA